MSGRNGHDRGVAATVEGIVQAVTPAWLEVDGERFTFSRFDRVDPPLVGDRVVVEADARGFVKSLEVLEGAEGGPNVQRAERSSSDVRVQVLVAAAAFGARRSDLKSADVLRIADSWLAWVRAEEASGA